MKIFLSFLLLSVNVIAWGQRDLTPRKRKDAFGTRDFRNLRNYGIQFSFGPTYQFTNLQNTMHFIDPGDGTRPFNYVIDPKGKLGGFIEIGFAHFPERSSFKTKPKKKNGDERFTLFKNPIISYYDYGLGFNYLGGYESTTIDYLNVENEIVNTEVGEGTFYNGYVYGRFTLHNLFYFKNSPLFLDNGLGVNFDYRLIHGSQAYSGDAHFPALEHFHKPFVAALHYNMGLGIRLKRGSYLVPGFQVPIMGFSEWHNGGNPSLEWFSSAYWPAQFKIKFIRILEKNSKNGCFKGSKEDKKMNDEFMQGQ
jgi:hypothetical protein